LQYRFFKYGKRKDVKTKSIGSLDPIMWLYRRWYCENSLSTCVARFRWRYTQNTDHRSIVRYPAAMVRNVERTWSRGCEILSTFGVDSENLLRFSEITKNEQIHYVKLW